MPDRDGFREKKVKQPVTEAASSRREGAGDVSGARTNATRMLSLQRTAGNRATTALHGGAASPKDRYLSAAEWSQRIRCPGRGDAPLSVQRIGNPVSPATKGHKHELGQAETTTWAALSST